MLVRGMVYADEGCVLCMIIGVWLIKVGYCVASSPDKARTAEGRK